MKTITFITTIYLLVTFTATVSFAIEDFVNYRSSEPVRHHRVKRKGGGRGGSRGGSSRKSSGRTPNRNPNPDPYPKQPAYNPNYNPAQQKPAYPNYNTGHQAGHGQPGQTGYNPNYGQNAKSGGLGGILGGGSGTGIGQKSKTGGLLGAGLGGAAAGGLAGAALGAYGGYKLGKVIGGIGHGGHHGGHYGYYDNGGRYMKCDPPRRVEWDPQINQSYIPNDVLANYDRRCEYYERDPSRYGYQNHNNYYQNSRYGINAGTNCFVGSHFILIVAFIFNAFISRVTLFRPQLYLT